MLQYLSGIMVRDLRATRREIEAFPTEADLWRTVPGVTNPAGNLALHIAGNLRHFIGAILGGDGYVRNRDAEFNARDVSRAAILADLDAAIATIERVLPNLPAEVASKDFPLPVANATLNTTQFLMHLAVHLTWHLGQMDYLRRVLTGEGGAIGAVAPGEIGSRK
jgi:uncharacterized damage-inducible protein DinB